MSGPVIISAAVEGIVDDAVVRKLITYAGGQPGAVYGRNGKPALRQKINGYNNAARHALWIVLVDLDREADCAPPLREAWLPELAPDLCFRVAVREIEAWLMADAETLRSFWTWRAAECPAVPRTRINRKRPWSTSRGVSRRRAVHEDMVPREGSGRPVGPAYASRLIEYVETRWRPGVAARHAESLRRAIACVERLIRKAA